MSNPKVYLAGPINGKSYDEATGWRWRVSSRLGAYHSIESLNPMRGKEHLAEQSVLQAGSYTSLMCTDRAIVTRDRHDVKRADVILINLKGAERVSIGTMVELGWASAYDKPIVTIMDDGLESGPHDHPFVTELSDFIVSDLTTAVDVVVSLLDRE